LNLDVEGWEKQVLLGASNLLHSQPPKAIVFEAECDVKARVTDNELRAILEEAQYTILHIPRQSGKMHTSLIKPCFVENFVAVHFHEV